MKRIILIMLIAILTLPVLAQNKTLFDQLTEKYADKTGFSASMLTSDLFDLYLKKKEIDEKSPVYAALKELDAIIVVSQGTYEQGFLTNQEYYVPNAGADNNPVASSITSNSKEKDEKNQAQRKEREQLFNEIADYYKSNQYTLFKTENQLGEDLKVYLKKENDLITSLALITNSAASTTLVELDGNIDLTTVAELNKALNLKGLEKLHKLNNSNNLYTGNYAVTTRNGIAFDTEKMNALQKELMEQQKLTKQQRAAIEDQARMAINETQAQMVEKMRQMSEIYGRQPILLSAPGDTNTVYYINGKKVKANEVKELDKKTISSIEVKNPEKEDDKTEVKIKTRK